MARMAANDFLRNPSLMMSSYLEWAAAVQALIKSGQLSTAGQQTQPWPGARASSS